MMPAARRQLAPKLSEAQLQKQVFNYLLWALPDDAVPFAVPNGGSRDWREAVNLKKTGTTAGIPDLEILYGGRALFVELKATDGALSKSQKYTIPRIERAGSPVAVCRSLDEVKTFLAEQGVPLRTERRSTERIRRGVESALADMVRDLPNDTLDNMVDEEAGR